MVMVNGKCLPKDEWYRRYYWDLRKNAWNCSRCSNCKWVDSWEVKSHRFAKICPSSQFYLFDAFSCQGRMDVALALIDGRLKYDDSPALLDIFYRCNFCGGCDAMCKRVQDMEPLRVIQEMRLKLVGDGQLLPSLIPVVEHLRKEDNMMLKPKSERGIWASDLKIKHLPVQRADFLFHAGCHYSYDESLWPTIRGAIELMIRGGLDIGIMGKDEICCGGRLYEMGYKGEFTKFAESNMHTWASSGVKAVVTSCSDCYFAFKRLYSELGLKVEVFHTMEIILKLMQQKSLRPRRTVPQIITYHDPCHLGRRLPVYVPGEPIVGIYDTPRTIINSIPGVKLVEMERIKEYAWCCGAGGGVRESYPEFNNFTAKERLTEAKATGADTVVTACPWCQRNLKDVASNLKESIVIQDISELVRMAL